MGRRKKYRDPAPFAKRPKDHERVVVSEGTYYLRAGFDRRKRILKETPSRLKMRNLLKLQLDYLRSGGNPNVEEFCKKRQISTSNYRRLIALVKEVQGDDDGSGNSIPDTATNKRYRLVLAMNGMFVDGGVKKENFCSRYKISRSSFFRYLADIEDFIASEGEALTLCIDADSGEYRTFFPYFLGY